MFANQLPANLFYEFTDYKGVLDAPFTRFSQDIANQPQFFEDIDKERIHFTHDNFERLKVFQPEEGTTNGDWYHMAMDDNDSNFKWSGIEGDTFHMEPPDSNFGPAIDHRGSEEKIWNFNLNSLGLEEINNEWITNPTAAMKRNFMPHWKDKMLAVDYVTVDKVNNFVFQWGLKIGFEALKKKQAIAFSLGEDTSNHEQQLKDYIKNSYDQLHARKLEKVYVTDHTPKQKKYITTSESEDEQFFQIQKAIDEYNKDATAPKKTSS